MHDIYLATLALMIIAATLLYKILPRLINAARRAGYLFCKHDTVPLKRIGNEAFVVQCMRCGWLYFKAPVGGRWRYWRYYGEFDDLEDYATEPAEAEPMFVDSDDTNV